MRQFALLFLSAAVVISITHARCISETTEPTSAMPILTREYLIAHGFKPSPKDPDAFKAENVRLGDIAKGLGFGLASLHPAFANARPGDEWFSVVVQRFLVHIRPEPRPPVSRGKHARSRDPDRICTVWLSKYIPPKPPIPTDGNPCLKITSVTLPKDRKGPLVVAFELSTDGKTSLILFPNEQLSVRLFKGETCVYLGRPSLKDFTELVTVKPGKPAHLIIRASENSIVADPDSPPAPDQWQDLAPGKYTLRVVAASTMKRTAIDYLWAYGFRPIAPEKRSDPYIITIPGK